jgi:CspA family cold shock protein
MSQQRHIASGNAAAILLEFGASATPAKESTMATGTVKWFNTQKGFGFIQPDDGGKDVFVHISAVERAGMGSLAEGQKIKYEVTMDRGKPAATNLSAA